jgi:CRP-like cAMP-binding protein
MAVLYTDFGVQPVSILTASSVLAAVVGFALQETLGNIFSGLSLSLGHPFEPGDWIRSGVHLGRVKGIAWRATTIVTRANERLEIPNSVIAKDTLYNYATGAVCDEISIGLSYGVPPNHVREVVLSVLRDVPQIMHTRPPEVLAWNYADFSIQYRIKYWISDYGVQEYVRDRVASSLWYALRRHSIEIPFPTRTVNVHDAGRDEIEHADAGFERELMHDLRQVDWLRGLNDEELRMLVPSVDVRQFGAGEMLIRQGEQGESMFIFRSGTAEFFAHTPDGQTRHLGNYVRGDFTGEMALMTGEPRSASVRATTDVEVIEMDREGLTSLFKERPDVAAAIGAIIAARTQQLLEKMSAADSLNGRSSPRRWLLAKMRELFDIQEKIE